MSTISPALAGAFNKLRNTLYEYIDNIEYVVEECDDTEVLPLAHAEFPQLVALIRRLLTEHSANDYGVCQPCGRSWPCPVVQTAYEFLNDPNRVLRNSGLDDED